MVKISVNNHLLYIKSKVLLSECVSVDFSDTVPAYIHQAAG